MKNKGITLVALIITIIILLILATVSISLIINSGILDKAKYGVDKYSEEEELEQIKLSVASARLKGNGFLDTDNLNSELHERIDENENAKKMGDTWYYKGYTIDENGNVEKYDKLLPKEFQEVEYTKNTGTQYIDTNVIPDENTSVKLDIMPLETSGKAFFGCIEIDQVRTWRLFNYSNRIYFDLCDRKSGGRFYPNERINIELYNNYVLLEGVEVLKSNKKNNLNLTSTLYIFAANQSNSSYTGLCSGRAKIYICKIYSNNILIRDFIPCYSITTVTDVDGIERPAGTIGMYDTVEGKFYTNQGTGEFIAGPDV